MLFDDQQQGLHYIFQRKEISTLPAKTTLNCKANVIRQRNIEEVGESCDLKAM